MIAKELQGLKEMSPETFKVKHSLTDEQLASLLQVSPRTVRYWTSENRSPRPIIGLFLALVDSMLGQQKNHI